MVRKMEAMEMEEQWLKSNTDCVYFLASPLTCNKGIDCEYRHSEIARLNPRDCWYWLAGNCLNPDCAFRHPPLDGATDGLLEPAYITYNEPADTSLKKTNVPCYFFFNGYCHKGERCSFMHNPNRNPNRKSTKTVYVSTVFDAPLIKKKIAVGRSDARSSGVPTATNANNPCEKITGINDIIKPEVKVHQSIPDKNVAAEKHTGSQQYPEQSTTCRSNSSRAFTSERNFSSPGFDVLVDYDTILEDDPNDFLCKDVEATNIGIMSKAHQYVVGYGYGEEYDVFHEHEGCCCDHSSYNEKNPLREILFSNDLRRKIMPRPTSSGSMDLRDLLEKKRRLMNRIGEDCFSRMFEFQGGRLGSRVVRNSVGTQIENRKNSNLPSRLSYCRSSLGCREKNRFKGKKQQQKLKSEVVGKAALKRINEAAITFTGPESFSRIREDEREQKGNMNSVQDFRGPKSLKEILEEKRM